MSIRARSLALLTPILHSLAGEVLAHDWPQWRGSDRSGRVTGFEEPATWPEQLTPVWKVVVGDGVSSPSLAGNRLYVFTLQDGNEVLRCLEASTGKELWQEKYPEQGADGPASSFAGPRSTPAVAEGKVVVLGVRGALSCHDAETGKLLWRNREYKAIPRFCTSSSPLILSGLCIAQLGGESEGSVVAFDLDSGEERWKWSEEGTAYASPVLLTGGDTQVVVATTSQSVVGIRADEGKVLWKTPFVVRGRGYNAATPIVDGQTLILSGSGRGTRALEVAREGDSYHVNEIWVNEDNSVLFNSPVLKDGLVYGISASDVLFCVSTEHGGTLWTAPVAREAEGEAAEGGEDERGGRGRGRGGSGGGGYGSIVDGGSVLFALTPRSELIVFAPDEIELLEIARYKVSDTRVYAHPILAGHDVYVKDQDSVALWRIGDA